MGQYILWHELLKEHLNKHCEGGALLRACRKDAGLTQKEFGKRLGMRQQHVSCQAQTQTGPLTQNKSGPPSLIFT